MLEAQAHPENTEQENILDLGVRIMYHLGNSVPMHFVVIRICCFPSFFNTDKDHADVDMTQLPLIKAM